jgi:AcrR family transcriptional regulator
MAYRRTERESARLAARYGAIIDAARALASESGLRAVHIAPVAERAGVAAGTVYRYFPSKEDLVAAVISDTAERKVAAIRAATASAPGALSGLAAAFVAFGAGTLRARRLTFAMLADVPDGAQAGSLTFRRDISNEFEGLIRAAIAGGHLPERPPWQRLCSAQWWKASWARSPLRRPARTPNAPPSSAWRCSRYGRSGWLTRGRGDWC